MQIKKIKFQNINDTNTAFCAVLLTMLSLNTFCAEIFLRSVSAHTLHRAIPRQVFLMFKNRTRVFVWLLKVILASHADIFLLSI